MLQKKELLKLAMSMDIEPAYEPFYRFAQNYAFHITSEQLNDTAGLFSCIMYCRNKPRDAAPRLGLRGKDSNNLVKWCEYVLGRNELRKLSITELNYVFACCARYCKAKTR